MKIFQVAKLFSYTYVLVVEVYMILFILVIVIDRCGGWFVLQL